MNDVELVKSIQAVLETQAKLLNNITKSRNSFSEYQIANMNRAFMSAMKACVLLNIAFEHKDGAGE